MSILLLAIARAARPRSAKAKRLLLVSLVLAIALVIFAPTIVVQTPLRRIVLARIVPPSVGAVTAEKITAGWLTPIAATGVRLVDTAGQRLADVERLTVDRSIATLLGNRSDWGLIRLENPTFYVLVRPDGSSLEDLMHAYLGPAKDAHDGTSSSATAVATSPAIRYRLEIQGGQLLSRDASTGVTWSAESFTAAVEQPGGGPLQVEASGVLRPAADQPVAVNWPAAQEGSGRFEFRWGPAGERPHSLQLICQQVPLAALEPWLARFDSQLQLLGNLTGELSVSHPVAGESWLPSETTGRLTVAGLQLTATPLAGEPFYLEQTDLAWRAAATRGQLAIENLSLASDVAMADMQGTIPVETIDQMAGGDWKPIFLSSGSDIIAEGRLHLARLVERLPGLLRVQDGTTLSSGQVRFAARSRPENTGQQLNVSLTTTPLTGVANGKPISWDAPLAIDLAARRRGSEVRIERLACESEFVSVTGSGNARQMQASGRVDLDELANRLGQFLDLTDWRLAGQGELQVRYRRDESHRFTADGSGKLTAFEVVYRGDPLVTEPRLEWNAALDGQMPADAVWPSRFTSGQLSLVAADDRLTAELSEPTVAGESWSTTDWPLQVATTGDINAWVRRLRPWVDMSRWNVAGRVELAASGRFRGQPLAVRVVQSDLAMRSLRATSDKWNIDEPRVEWHGDIAWDAASGVLSSRDGRLVSSTVAASLRDWYWAADPEQAGRVGGLAAVRADLARLKRARRDSDGETDALNPVGEMSGNVKLAAQAGRVVAAIDLLGKDIALQKREPALPGAPPALKEVWQEPQLRVVGSVSYVPEADRLKFDGIQVQSATLILAASGSIDRLSTESQVNLAGTAEYDLIRLTPLFAQYVGPGLTVAGREQAQFEVRGSLAGNAGTEALRIHTVTDSKRPAVASAIAANWYARLLAPWQSASLFGLPVGRGRIAAELDRGQVAIEPLDFEVGGGRLQAAPTLLLDPPPGEFRLAPGRLLRDVRITPDVSEQMLKFIAPPLAGATRSEGLFSLTIADARVPLGEPEKADVAGQLEVKSVKVAPGPMVAEWVALAREIEALLRGQNPLSAASRDPATLVSIVDRTVDFRLVDGRVYHQGLEFEIGELVVRSRGSVGLDETLSIVLEFQVPEKWLGRWARSAGGRPPLIEIPVTGTFRHPRLEKQALGSLLQQVAPEALNRLLGDEVGSALDKLFGTGR